MYGKLDVTLFVVEALCCQGKVTWKMSVVSSSLLSVLYCHQLTHAIFSVEWDHVLVVTSTVCPP